MLVQGARWGVGGELGRLGGRAARGALPCQHGRGGGPFCGRTALFRPEPGAEVRRPHLRAPCRCVSVREGPPIPRHIVATESTARVRLCRSPPRIAGTVDAGRVGGQDACGGWGFEPAACRLWPRECLCRFPPSGTVRGCGIRGGATQCGVRKGTALAAAPSRGVWESQEGRPLACR